LTELGKTVIYVTHARELAARASARIDLLDGRIVSRRPIEIEVPTSGTRGGAE
jgi:ABC-type lipoprotein export system ATPase subunit